MSATRRLRAALPTLDRSIEGAGWLAPFARAVLAVAIAVGIAVGARLLVIADADATLVVMGFDPDRARLIDALVVGFVAAALARVVSGASWGSAVGGAAAFGVLFAKVFRRESVAAVGASGTGGRFDPSGWLVTVGTLVLITLVVAGAASLLGGHVRRFVAAAIADLRSLRTTRARGLHRLARPLVLVVGVVLAAAAGPVFGDMVNYTPDVHMRQGAVVGPALTDTGAGPNPAPSDGSSAVADAPSPSPVVQAPSGTLASAPPWTADRPSGSGRLVSLQLPAPWTGGRSSLITVYVYTPPGYDSSPTRRYPTAYEAPFSPGAFPPFLDGYFTSGTAPAQILVFVTEAGGPYPDSECSDSLDGREHMASWIVDTLVPWIDGHYRTIRSADARATFGWSQGGFCSAMLLLRNVDVFHTSISLDGYYQAGVASGQTVNAWRPWGGNPAYEAQFSPLDLAAAVPAAVAKRLLLVVAGDPTQPFFGTQLQAFVGELGRQRIPYVLFPDTFGHGWQGYSHAMPRALRVVGLHEAALGVFGPNA
jgi:enterochelin esterase-like enzyme